MNALVDLPAHQAAQRRCVDLVAVFRERRDEHRVSAAEPTRCHPSIIPCLDLIIPGISGLYMA